MIITSALINTVAVVATLYTSVSWAEELRIPYIVEDSCPFEGCTYGKWRVTSNTPIYKEAKHNSEVIGKLAAGETTIVETGVSYITPGKAKIIGEPYKEAKALNTKELIFILNYIGEGYSRIYQNGIIVEAKVARKKNQCTKNPNWRYCWVEILQEPTDSWWVKIKDVGWVPMVNTPLKPLDSLSAITPYNRVKAGL